MFSCRGLSGMGLVNSNLKYLTLVHNPTIGRPCLLQHVVRRLHERHLHRGELAAARSLARMRVGRMPQSVRSPARTRERSQGA